MNPEEDFVPVNAQDPKLSSLVKSVMETDDITKDRKTHLSIEQALQIARARAFADSFIVEEEVDGELTMIEEPLQIIHMICDYLENTSVSIQGRGMKQLEAILTAQVRAEETNGLDRTAQRVMR